MFCIEQQKTIGAQPVARHGPTNPQQHQQQFQMTGSKATPSLHTTLDTSCHVCREKASKGYNYDVQSCTSCAVLIFIRGG
jgi:hypothetical protein